MEQYKIINAELMDQVQKQRIIIGEMLKTEVILKKQLFEERETRLIDTQHHECKLKAAIRTLMQSLDLNMSFATDAETRAVSPEPDYAENGSSNRFSGSQICSELRRSSALHHRSVTLSPSRRSRRSSSQNEKSPVVSEHNETEANKQEIVQPRRLNQLEGHLSSPDPLQSPALETSAVIAEVDEPSVYVHQAVGGRHMSSIIEETDSEEDAMSISSATSLSTCSSVSLGETTMPLCDVTNKINTTNTKNTKKVTKSSRILDDSNMRDTIHMPPPSLPKEPAAPLAIPKVVVTRGEPKRGRPKLERSSDSESETKERSIERVRQAVRQSSPVPCQLLNTDSIKSPRPSQLNFTNFNGIAERPSDSSTPRPLKAKSKRGRKPKSAVNAVKDASVLAEQSSKDGSLSSRLPSRKCRPTSLKEPSTISKLRNCE